MVVPHGHEPSTCHCRKSELALHVAGSYPMSAGCRTEAISARGRALPAKPAVSSANNESDRCTSIMTGGKGGFGSRLLSAHFCTQASTCWQSLDQPQLCSLPEGGGKQLAPHLAGSCAHSSSPFQAPRLPAPSQRPHESPCLSIDTGVCTTYCSSQYASFLWPSHQ